MRDNTPPRSPAGNLNMDMEDNNVEINDVELNEDDDELIEVDPDDPRLLELLGGENTSDDENTDEGIDASTPVEDYAKVTFRGHNMEPIYSCALHPTLNLALTGGQDDYAFLWDTETGETKYKVEGHRETVSQVAFNYDGKYFATADLNGTIQVFKIGDGTVVSPQLIHRDDIGYLTFMFFHNKANVIFAGNEDGDIHVWRIPNVVIKVLPGFDIKCNVAQLTNDGKKLIAGYDDGTCKVFDIAQQTTCLTIKSPDGNAGGINAIAVDPKTNQFITGCDKGTISIASLSGVSGKLEKSKGMGSIESIEYCPNSEITLAATASLDGDLTVWNMLRQYERSVCKFDEQKVFYSKLAWVNNQKIIAATLSGQVLMFDGKTGGHLHTFRGHTAHVYDLKVDEPKQIILTVSEDGTAKIFKIPSEFL